VAHASSSDIAWVEGGAPADDGQRWSVGGMARGSAVIRCYHRHTIDATP
jgi:hypothetical protein